MNGEPNLRNKAAFLNSSSVVWTEPKNRDLKGWHTLGDWSRGLVARTCFGTSPLVCTRILHRNSSRKDHTFGPCD